MDLSFIRERDDFLRKGVKVEVWGVEWRVRYLTAETGPVVETDKEALAMGRQMAAERPLPTSPVIRKRRLRMTSKAVNKRLRRRHWLAAVRRGKLV